MRFAIISDIHLGPERLHNGVQQKLSRFSEKLTENFVDEMNTNIKPKMAIQLGDIIQDKNYELDKVNFEKGIHYLNKLTCPVHHAFGNHDQRFLTRNDLLTLTNRPELYYSFDIGNHHCIILYSDDEKKIQPYIPNEEIDWFKSDIEKTDKPTIIFVHHILSDQDLTGNFWFEGKPERCLIQNRSEIRNILNQSEKVIAVFQGHAHWNKQEICNGIPYFTIQSLVENYSNKEIPSGSYAIVDISDGQIAVDIKGNDSIKMIFLKNNPL